MITFVSDYSLIMTKKQFSIIQSALILFAESGFDAISTSKIAAHAGVSEGLIFRHFVNKEGLLEAILSLGHEKANGYFEEIIQTEDPKERLKKIIELPLTISVEEYPFWRLTYALKWQRGIYRDFSEPLEISLSDAFEQLGYAQPLLEAKLVLVYMDGIVTEMLLKGTEYSTSITQLFIDKYQL